jgi:hypothetical protein
VFEIFPNLNKDIHILEFQSEPMGVLDAMANPWGLGGALFRTFLVSQKATMQWLRGPQNRRSMKLISSHDFGSSSRRTGKDLPGLILDGLLTGEIVEPIAATQNGGIIGAIEFVTMPDLRGIAKFWVSEGFAHVRSGSIAGLNVWPFCDDFFLDSTSARGKRSTKGQVVIEGTMKTHRVVAVSRNTIIHSMPDAMGKVMGKETCNVVICLSCDHSHLSRRGGIGLILIATISRGTLRFLSTGARGQEFRKTARPGQFTEVAMASTLCHAIPRAECIQSRSLIGQTWLCSKRQSPRSMRSQEIIIESLIHLHILGYIHHQSQRNRLIIENSFGDTLGEWACGTDDFRYSRYPKWDSSQGENSLSMG